MLLNFLSAHTWYPPATSTVGTAAAASPNMIAIILQISQPCAIPEQPYGWTARGKCVKNSYPQGGVDDEQPDQCGIGAGGVASGARAAASWGAEAGIGVHDESGMTDPRSARGLASGRQFDPHNAGGLIRQLSPERVRITSRGVDVVERHVSRFGPDRANAVMIERLRAIADESIEPTPVDRGFYTHELREYVRYRKLGYTSGTPADPEAAHALWNNAHTATLEDYGLPATPSVLYHSEAERYIPK